MTFGLKDDETMMELETANVVLDRHEYYYSETDIAYWKTIIHLSILANLIKKQ